MRQLRTAISLEEYLARLGDAGGEGYRVHAAVDGDQAVGLVGWRLAHDLAIGRCLYIDDLVVDEEFRAKGVGRALMGLARRRAVASGCDTIRLSSAVHREDAHRFYQSLGLARVGYVFEETLRPSPAEPQRSVTSGEKAARSRPIDGPGRG